MPVSWDELPELGGAADWNVVTGIDEARSRLEGRAAYAVEQEITDRMRRAIGATD